MGPKSTQWLGEIGIRSTKDIEQFGVEVVFRMLFERGINVNALMLYALEGAVTNTHWNSIDELRKRELQITAQKIKQEVKYTREKK